MIILKNPKDVPSYIFQSEIDKKGKKQNLLHKLSFIPQKWESDQFSKSQIKE